MGGLFAYWGNTNDGAFDLASLMGYTFIALGTIQLVRTLRVAPVPKASDPK
jgi:hypothetical protein